MCGDQFNHSVILDDGIDSSGPVSNVLHALWSRSFARRMAAMESLC